MDLGLGVVVPGVPQSANQLPDLPLPPIPGRNSNSLFVDGYDLGHISQAQARDNAITGNIDYQRAIAQAERAEKVSAAEAQKARDWSEMMSNTAYSRAIADLKANGINPYAIGSFNASSTPSSAFGSAFSSSSASSGGNVTSYQTAYMRNQTELQKTYISAVSNLASHSLSALGLALK